MLLPFITLLAVIILCCVFLNSASNRFGVPVLLAFMLFGMLAANNSILPLSFPSDGKGFDVASNICTFALIFIMFFGGFGTRWKSARAVVKESALLATLGVVVTAAVTGLFCHFVLRWGWLEAFLMGSVVSSTDAASVFSILRSRKLGLKNNCAPLLEVESGSNDPMSYMLTVLVLSLMGGNASGWGVAVMLLKQIILGAGYAIVIAKAAAVVIDRRKSPSGFDSLLVLAVALLSYAIPSIFGGNGYLSAYIVGIYLGNREFEGKKALVHFFDGVTDLMMIVIFFILGMLAKPSHLLPNILPALAIFLCLLVIARPAAIFSVLSIGKKYPANQMSFISFVGLRGAASIVFAIMAMSSADGLQHDIFSIVFCIVLISISLQGYLIPGAAERWKVADHASDVMRTFSDFSEETDIQFSELKITCDSTWRNRTVSSLGIPKNLLICMIIRASGEKLIPDGRTVLREGDCLVLCSFAFKQDTAIRINTQFVEEGDTFAGRKLRDCSMRKNQVLLLVRDGQNIIPHGDTVFSPGDILYINASQG